MDGTLQREVKKVRKARNRRQEWNMMALDKELRPDHRHTIHRDRGASSEGSMSPENRCFIWPHLFTCRFFCFSPAFTHVLLLLLQGPRSGPAPLPQLNEPCWPRPHLLWPSAQHPGRTDGGGSRPSCGRGARGPGPDHDGLPGGHAGPPPPPPPPGPTASSTGRGHERRLHVPPSTGLQVNSPESGIHMGGIFLELFFHRKNYDVHQQSRFNIYY